MCTDYVLKALSALTTPEEKLAALCKKYTDLLDENRQHSSALKSSTKKLSQVSRERDSLQTENSKLILAKSKLESLCRELQRHNKVVKVCVLCVCIKVKFHLLPLALYHCYQLTAASGSR